MIAKQIPVKNSSTSSFAKLAKYMIAPLSKNERVGAVTLTNCESVSVAGAILEVLNTQALNTRARGDKTYHLVVSFPCGENPSAQILSDIEERICAVLGFADHQRISTVHHDTDHLHVHIAINKIHPTRYTFHEPFNAYFMLGQICAKLEAEFGLEKVDHNASKGQSENHATDMERNAQVESLIGWVKRECSEKLQSAQSWPELHQALREKGLVMKQRANGLVIVAEDGVMVKASSVGREFSKKALEGRLGAFIPSIDAPTPSAAKELYGKRPIASKAATVELYARYLEDQQNSVLARADEWTSAKNRKAHLIEDAKRSARLKRVAIKLLLDPGVAKKAMYAAVSRTLREEIKAINLEYLKNRQTIYERLRRRAWADWLREEAKNGDAEALGALRARSVRASWKGNTLHGPATQDKFGPTMHADSVTKHGTVIYSAGDCAIRDDGVRLQVSRGTGYAGLQTALRMAIDRYGPLISVNGSAAFKQEIVAVAAAAKLEVCFDDRALELRRQQSIASFKIKEKQHGCKHNPGNAGQRRARCSRRAAACAAARSNAGAWNGTLHAVSAESHLAKPGQAAPTESSNRMRELSEFGVVHVTEGSEVLLPRDVPDHVEHKRSEPHHQLRWHLRGAGILTEKPSVAPVGTAPPPSSRDRLQPLSSLGTVSMGNSDRDVAVREAASTKPKISPAGKYVFEREQKRLKGFDIPKHTEYSFCKGHVFSYEGIRVVDGQALVLLKCGDEINVFPIDAATTNRLKRKPLGCQLSVTATGAITAKGRGR